jgi:hypothetical protein
MVFNVNYFFARIASIRNVTEGLIDVADRLQDFPDAFHRPMVRRNAIG